MRALRLRNIRSLADTGDILLKPITLLLGQNSSGKSTVLRTLPLLKQSIRTRSNAPVLWYGDLVDFGSAREVISTFARDQSIDIEFDLGPMLLNRGGYYYYASRDDAPVDTRLKISLSEIEGRTKLRQFAVQVDSDEVRIDIDSKGVPTKVFVNGIDFTRIMAAEKYKFSSSEIVPQLIKSGADPMRRAYYPRSSRVIESAEREIRKFFSDRLPSRVRENTILNLAHRINYRPGLSFAIGLQEASTSLKSTRDLALRLTSPNGAKELALLKALFLLWELPDILTSIERSVGSTFSSVSYVGPSRATGERYYRMQELAVDQIDPQGRNLAMFLNSLTAGQQRQFSEWLTEAVGYAVKVERSTGHIQLHLREENSDRFYNIADMGYGFSQVLPIMAQVWSRRNRTSFNRTSVLMAMEQPELHLHPAYQAKLADVFVRSISKGSASPDARRDARFVIETHSEALINRLGELVYDGSLDPDDVAIYVFEKAQSQESTSIRTVTFESDGTLSNWPIGFFSTIR